MRPHLRFWIAAHEFLLQVFESLLGTVADLEEIEILGADRSPAHESVEIEEIAPELLPVENNRERAADFPSLDEGQDLEKFVHRAEAAGEDYQSARQIGEPELAHEEVVELEQQVGRDEGVGPLLVWKTDRQSHGRASRPLRRASVCR